MKKHVAFLLSICLLFSFVSCVAPDNPPPDPLPDNPPPDPLPDNPPPDDTEEILPVTFDLTTAFRIIYAPGAENAGYELADDLSLIFGTVFEAYPDTEPIGEFELLVGQTNRYDTSTLTEDLKPLDCGYQILSGTRIQIFGLSAADLVSGALFFLRDCFSYDEATHVGTARALTSGDPVYSIFTPVRFTVLGHDITSFTIVTDGTSDALAYAKRLRLAIGKPTGVSLEITPFSEFVGGDAFYIGNFDTDAAVTTYEIGYEIFGYALRDGVISIFSGGDPSVISSRRADLLADFSTEKEEVMLSYPPLAVTYAYQEYLFGLNFAERTEAVTLAEGITYWREHLTNDSGAAVDFSIVKITPSAAPAFLMGTNRDEITFSIPDPEDRKTSTVKQHAEAAAANGKVVIAAINGDFFVMEGDYRPTSNNVKDGVAISTGSSRPYFAMRRDGTFYIGRDRITDELLAETYTLIGGDPLLVYDGRLTEITRPDGTQKKMRTGVGYDSEGNVYFVTSDTYTNQGSATALTLYDFQRYMKNFIGCTYALNFDGGGSTEMVIRNPETEQYEFGSFGISYGGGVERKIFNSLMVVIDYEIPQKEDAP